MLVVGVADDLWDLDWMTKLASQILIAGFLAWASLQIVSLPIGPENGITVLSPTLSLIVTVLAIVLVMNAVNFIDGLDGLVAGVTLIAGGVFFIYSYILSITTNQSAFNLASLTMAVLLGATAGFLPLNWHPAKMFMGDGGALVVGMLMAISTITVTSQINPSSSIAASSSRRSSRCCCRSRSSSCRCSTSDSPCCAVSGPGSRRSAPTVFTSTIDCSTWATATSTPC